MEKYQVDTKKKIVQPTPWGVEQGEKPLQLNFFV